VTTNTRETIQFAIALIAAWEAHDLSATARLLSDDFVLTGPAPVALGKQEFLTFQAIHNESFADWRFNPSVISADGASARVQFQITATHTGAFDVSRLGLPVPSVAPTGKSRAWPAEHMTVTVRDSTIARLDVQSAPGGGLIGTLEWLGVVLPESVA
jgi:hypothetical protein